MFCDARYKNHMVASAVIYPDPTPDHRKVREKLIRALQPWKNLNFILGFSSIEIVIFQ